MLRRPSNPVTSPGASTGTAVLTRRGSARATFGTPGGGRRRPAGRDVPVESRADVPAPAGGVVPRMRRPRGSAESVRVPRQDPARGALDARIERHLTRLRETVPAPRPEAVDDDRARRDPDTASFAAIRTPSPRTPSSRTHSARVASASDRRRTAEFPALSVSPGER